MTSWKIATALWPRNDELEIATALWPRNDELEIATALWPRNDGLDQRHPEERSDVGIYRFERKSKA